MLKMDIQGFEAFAINGASEMLSTKPPAFFFIEYSAYQYRKHGQDALGLLNKLMAYGYTFAQIGWHGDASGFGSERFAAFASAGDDVETDFLMTNAKVLNDFRDGRIAF
eukprot:m.347504 g.347504  ORF g.347504 m.347504 type:complete len:109 (+) comp55856_c0_seq2:1027-1353(+)